jgi:hypothetical protein
MMCAISKLHLQPEVYWFLLTENPHRRSDENRYWVPRTWPILADWNYGSSIDLPDLNDCRVKAVIQGLNVDMLERGPGSGSYPKPVTHKGMDFKQLLYALQQERVMVDENALYPTINPFGTQYPQDPYYPTLQNVQAILSNVEECGPWLVDEMVDGGCQVRSGGGSILSLLPARQALSPRFATVITHGPELKCFPQHNSAASKYVKRNLNVRQTFVRRDVWDKLVHTPMSDVPPISQYREDVQGAMAAYVTLLQTEWGLDEFAIFRRWMTWYVDIREKYPCAERMVAEVQNFSSLNGTLTSHSEIIRRLGGWNPAFANTVAEFSRICDIMRLTHLAWEPSTEGQFLVNARSQSELLQSLKELAENDAETERGEE